MSDCRLIEGDCLDVLRTLPSGSVDAVVTDPPAGIGFMGKGWDKNRGGRFQWIAWLAERMSEAARVSKPGHYALVWALPRTSHWTACAVEDGGWEIIDRLAHIFGQGFPKSKARLKPAVEDWWLCRASGGGKVRELGINACRVAAPDGVPLFRDRGEGVVNVYGDTLNGSNRTGEVDTKSGRYPTNLCLTHHPDCAPAGTRRVKSDGHFSARRTPSTIYGNGKGLPCKEQPERYTADPDGTEEVAAWLCVDGCSVKALDEMSGERKSGANPTRRSSDKFRGVYADFAGQRECVPRRGADSGSASRFFPSFAVEAADFAPFTYCPKASRKDRGEGNSHPTVKPQALMRWLCRLITPPGGVVLDPFAGSGSTLLAARTEGFAALGIEREPEYAAIARARLNPSPCEVA